MSAVIVVDADTSGFVRKTKQATDSAKKGAQDLTTQFGKMAENLVKVTAVFNAIGQGIRAAAQEYKRLKDLQKEEGTTAGTLNVRGAIAGDRAGLGGKAMGLINTAQGTKSRAERVAFLESISGNKDFQGLGQGDQLKIQQLQASGLFSDTELTNAIKRGGKGERGSLGIAGLSESLSRREMMAGPDYQRLLKQAQAERTQELLKESAVRDVDLRRSTKDRAAELARLENPGVAAAAEGITAGLESLPFVGATAGSLSRGASDIGFEILASLKSIDAKFNPPINLPQDPDR